jgi:hypothetical protein
VKNETILLLAGLGAGAFFLFKDEVTPLFGGGSMQPFAGSGMAESEQPTFNIFFPSGENLSTTSGVLSGATKKEAFVQTGGTSNPYAISEYNPSTGVFKAAQDLPSMNLLQGQGMSIAPEKIVNAGSIKVTTAKFKPVSFFAGQTKKEALKIYG